MGSNRTYHEVQSSAYKTIVNAGQLFISGSGVSGSGGQVAAYSGTLAGTASMVATGTYQFIPDSFPASLQSVHLTAGGPTPANGGGQWIYISQSFVTSSNAFSTASLVQGNIGFAYVASGAYAMPPANTILNMILVWNNSTAPYYG